MEKVRIQDDLYMHVNGEWLEKAVIPDDKPTAGGFADLSKGVEELLLKDFNAFAKQKDFADKHIENAVKLFRLVKDEKRRDKEGIEPAYVLLNQLEELKDMKDFNAKLVSFIRQGMTLPFSVQVSDDMKDSTKYCVMITGPDTILPDSSYYKPEKAEQKKALLKAFTDMAKKLLEKTNLSKSKQSSYLKDALAFDELVAKFVKSQEEWADYTKIYNPKKLTGVNTMMKPVAFKKAICEIFGDKADTIIVAEPRFFKNFKEVFNEETFELYKHWAYLFELYSASKYLSEELRDMGSTYERTLTGVAAIPSLEKFAYQTAAGIFKDPVGLYYGEKYFGVEAKKDVIEMVKEIIETYKKRIKKNDFLSEETKKKAILKLSTMGLKMAYPDKVDPIYDLLVIDEKKSFYENHLEIVKVKLDDSFKKLGKPVDKKKWVMPGHMVNACYNPTFNDITFPAAILQAPFYSIKQTRSQNLGGIGAVIAHEISHAFDNNGAKFDENGNLNNWWTKEDFKKFNARTKAMVKQFDGIELPQGKVNGKFIVSENIADNGGMAATLEVMHSTKNADYKEYFINWAKIWCKKAKPEYSKLILSIDVHAPSELRANMTPRNFEEWYTAFDVKKTDKMYIAPNKRVNIW